MKDSKIRFNKYTIHLILGTFIVCLIGVFFENITFFKNALIQTFAEPRRVASVDINTDKLAEIAKDINIGEDKIVLIKK